MKVYVDHELPMAAYPSFVSWLDMHMPGRWGSTNHSWWFSQKFGRCCTRHAVTCAAAQHWGRLPALRIPSDFSRAIDGYTCMGEGILVVIHFVVSSTGELYYVAASLSPNANDSLPATREGDNGVLHAWKSGAATGEHVRHCDKEMWINDVDAAARHATTNADGCLLGGNPIDFQISEFLDSNRRYNPNISFRVQTARIQILAFLSGAQLNVRTIRISLGSMSHCLN